MNNYSTVLLGILAVISIQSCQNDEHGPDEVNVDPTGLLLDGGQISDISLYCIENNNTHIGENYYEYNPRIKTLKNYSDFYLYIELNRNGSYYQSDDWNEMNAIGKLEEVYYKAKSSFIVEDYERYENKKDGWPELFTAYADGEVSITCDKELFGEQAGTNLNKYFTVNKGITTNDSKCLPIGIEEPMFLYKFGEEIPSDMEKFFLMGTWLQPKYYLVLKDVPSERYDVIKFYFTLPMIREHVRDYAVEKYRGKNVTPQLTKDVFKAECLIKFNWE